MSTLDIIPRNDWRSMLTEKHLIVFNQCKGSTFF